MPRKYKVLKDLQSRGLEVDKMGVIDSPWEVIDNMVIEGGTWRKRPAWRRLVAEIPSGTKEARTKALVEFTHNSIVADSTETEDPDADGTFTSWTRYGASTNWQAVDDGATPDNHTTFLRAPKAYISAGSNYANKRFSVKFPALTTNYDLISSVNVYIRTYAEEYQFIDATHLDNMPPYLVVGFKGTDGKVYSIGTDWHRSGRTWRTLYFRRTVNLETGKPFTNAEIDDIEIVVDNQVNHRASFAGSISAVRCTSVRMDVVGKDSSADRTRSKIFVTSSDWLRMKEDLTAVEDIDSGDAATITTNDEVVWDWAFFNEKVYFTNGTDDVAFYPASGSDVMDTVGASKPVGRCLGAYAARLFQGDVVESATRTRYRLVWCKTNDATDWDDEKAGFMDLDETPGEIVAMANFTEARDQTFIGILAVFKDDSIFHIEATGAPSDPFDKRVMNSDIGIVARHTLKQYTKPDGTQVLAFLGQAGGKINVFEWDGDKAIPIADPILDTFLAKISDGDIDQCWAVVDPNTYTYVLGYPGGKNLGIDEVSPPDDEEDEDIVQSRTWSPNAGTALKPEVAPAASLPEVPSQGSGERPAAAYVYDITNRSWSHWNFPPIDMVGVWRIIGDRWSAVGGRDDARIYHLDPRAYNDTDESGALQGIPAELRTGALRLSEDPLKRSILYRVWIFYRAWNRKAVFRVKVSTNDFRTFDEQVVTTPVTPTAAELAEQADGYGDTSAGGLLVGNQPGGSTPTEEIPDADIDGRIAFVKVDFRTEGHLHGVSIASNALSEEMEIEQIILEYEEQDIH